MNFTFELTDQEANIVLSSLAKQPYEAVAGLIVKIQQQAERQLSSHDKSGSAGDSK